MEYKTLVGRVKIPVLGMGTWGIGGGYRPDRSKDKEIIEVLQKGVKLGMTHIDTAEIYGGGHAEEIVGEAVKPFKREKLFITTKVSPHHFGYDSLINSLKASLERLKMDYVDLYLLHFPNPLIHIRHTMEALDYAVEQDMVKYIGVSNFSLKQMMEAQSHSSNRIVANQVEYSLLHRDPEKNLLSYCQKKKIMIIAYTPLAKGSLASPGFDVLDNIAEKYGKTQAQVALNWLISKEMVVSIPKVSSLEHLKDNLGAVGWKLSREDMERLNEGFK